MAYISYSIKEAFRFRNGANRREGGLFTLPLLGENAGGDAADVLPPDAGVPDLHFDVRQRQHLHVPLIGQKHQADLAVVLRFAADEPGHAHPPHPGSVHGGQLQLRLGAHLRQSENLNGEKHPTL